MLEKIKITDGFGKWLAGKNRKQDTGWWQHQQLRNCRTLYW